MGSKRVAAAAVRMALSESREEESRLKKEFFNQGIKTTAVDYGGEYVTSAIKIVERAIVAAKREGVIKDTHAEEGAVAGATREALSQIMPKGLGFNIGGKIGIARQADHVGVALFFGIGLVHLDEVAIGLGHRAVP
ncbi:MAG: hut operon positive regulator HutP [Clostridia bacterium]|nr:hut operon positive regulator HutP [Clostridia bacterium]